MTTTKSEKQFAAHQLLQENNYPVAGIFTKGKDYIVIAKELAWFTEFDILIKMRSNAN